MGSFLALVQCLYYSVCQNENTLVRKYKKYKVLEIKYGNFGPNFLFIS